MEPTSTREKIVQALSRGDESSRMERAKRIEWLATHDSHPSAYWGEIDTLRLMEEARVCFISGHFVAALLLATSFVEHALADELFELGHVKGRPTLDQLIGLARAHLHLPSDLLDRADQMRKLRNPFTHRRPGTDVDTLMSRFVSAKVHPVILMEVDAKLAVSVMYELFGRTLQRT